MSKFFYATLLALALAAGASAQTRRGTTSATPSTQRRPAAGTTAKPPAPKPTPAPAPARPQPPPAAAAVDKAAEECGCEDKPLPEVLAVVNGVKIAAADISQPVRQQISEMQRQVADARKNELNLQINSILLEAEAKKRGMSAAKLLEDEVVAKAVNPTDAEAQAYFEQNRARIEAQAGRRVEFAELRENVVNYLRVERQQARAQQFSDQLRAAHDVKVLVPTAARAVTPEERARVLATVNGKNITAGDIEDSLLPLIAQVQEQVYLLRKNALDMKINDLLLTEEATKRGVTARALLEAEITSKVPIVTEAQALDFYNKNKERINGDFPQVKYQIIEFLQDSERQKLEGAFASKLRNTSSVQTFITPPAPPVFKIDTDDQPSKGNPNAKVTVVEFTDYQCPSCAQTHPVVERLITEYGDRVRFVVRDFPLAQHAEARKAAEAAEAAREQGKYWDFTAILFKNQSSLKPEMLKQYAGVLGLDRAKFDAALDSGKFAGHVQRDILDGQKVGVSATPTFFVNGRRVGDRTYEALKAAIEAALKSP